MKQPQEEVSVTNPTRPASLAFGKQQRGSLEHSPGRSPVLPATDKVHKHSEVLKVNLQRPSRITTQH